MIAIGVDLYNLTITDDVTMTFGGGVLTNTISHT